MNVRHRSQGIIAMFRTVVTPQGTEVSSSGECKSKPGRRLYATEFGGDEWDIHCAMLMRNPRSHTAVQSRAAV